jgi:site-specific recombinase XerD
MPASRNRRTAAALPSRRVEAFLEMLMAERGAARLTLAAYRNDLADLAGFVAARGQALDTADPAALHDYLAAAATRRLAPRTVARRLSAMRTIRPPGSTRRGSAARCQRSWVKPTSNG